MNKLFNRKSNILPVQNITTHAHREIFRMEQLHPGIRSKIWFYQLIQGQLNVQLLTNVIEKFTLKIPLLQTRFAFYDEELWQIYDRSIHHGIKTIDVSNHPTPLEESLKQMREAANKPCIITGDKLYEFTIYIIGNKRHV